MPRIHVHIVTAPRAGARGPFRWLDEILERADEYAIDRLSTGDVLGNHLECFTALGYMAGRTSRAQLGPFITTAAHRDVAMIAASTASLDAVTDGRAFLVLGRGDGIVRNLGMRPQTVEETADAACAIRGLLAGQPHGRVRLAWPEPPGARIPIYLAAGGPRMVRAAAEVADGVYLATGTTEASVARARRTLTEVERDRRLDMWWVTRFGIADSTDEALAVASEGLSSIGNHALRGGDLAARDVPEELWPALREYHDRYSYERKNAAGGGRSNVDLMNELGLRDYFLERFGIVGTPQEVVARLIELERRGVDSVTLLVSSLHELDLIGADVLPALREQVSAA
jgi:5,10-methylenetetrahydromethanopterin reductase